MKVIGVDIRDVPTSNIIQRVVPPDMLNSVLPEADVVFVSVPHTAKSEGMMGAREFELMKTGLLLHRHVARQDLRSRRAGEGSG